MAFSWADELVSFFSFEHLFSLILASFRVIGSLVCTVFLVSGLVFCSLTWCISIYPGLCDKSESRT